MHRAMARVLFELFLERELAMTEVITPKFNVLNLDPSHIQLGSEKHCEPLTSVVLIPVVDLSL